MTNIKKFSRILLVAGLAFGTLFVGRTAEAIDAQKEVSACLAKGCGAWCGTLPYIGFTCYCLCSETSSLEASTFEEVDETDGPGAVVLQNDVSFADQNRAGDDEEIQEDEQDVEASYFFRRVGRVVRGIGGGIRRPARVVAPIAR